MIQQNGLLGGVYAEPFAGGSGVAISLLLDRYIDHAIINDIDPCIFAFWYSVLNLTDELCQKIYATDVNMEEWYRQRQILQDSDTKDLLELGFATFFLNRTNRSGILSAGVIGGKHQSGQWKVDARYPRERLIKKIQEIGAFRDRISLFNVDARVLINKYLVDLPRRSLVYLDPPYYKKGQKLYLNALNADDHVLIAHSISTELNSNWMISYDNTQAIRELYCEYRQSVFQLNYTAANRYEGSEVIIYSNGLEVPDIENPFRLNKSDVNYIARPAPINLAD